MTETTVAIKPPDAMIFCVVVDFGAWWQIFLRLTQVQSRTHHLILWCHLLWRWGNTCLSLLHRRSECTPLSILRFDRLLVHLLDRWRLLSSFASVRNTTYFKCYLTCLPRTHRLLPFPRFQQEGLHRRNLGCNRLAPQTEVPEWHEVQHLWHPCLCVP